MITLRLRFAYTQSGKNVLFVMLILLLVMILSACASPPGLVDESLKDANELEIVWPPPPQEARIRLLTSISGPSDIGIKRSWLRKRLDSLLGESGHSVSMLRPYGIFAEDDTICVTDPGISVVHIFNIKKNTYYQIRKYGEKRLASPIGITGDKDALYVSDSVLRKVLVFDKEGNYIREIVPPDNFIRPTGIAVHENKIYVVDTLANKIFILDKNNGNLLTHFGRNGIAPGEFHYPTNIFIARDYNLYITDSLNFRIQIFDIEGNFLSAFGRHGNSSGDFSKPKGVSVDSDGHIYVADADFDNIQIFDRSGRLLLFFGNTGRKKGEMVLPAGIFIDGNDRIYVADSYNKRIQIFRYLKGEN